ncbi:uncharacterized protein LOC126737481 [Anthonomus grandis grandis]|uniref:uncharacterized protein LOC126737481 n=1 Tax=Anthonomus grandis grandis TaxID=2921223 RepID=UPI002166A9DC|nr:uncharacterized protein LOC126737481 [Anthonomus grandis grandis]
MAKITVLSFRLVLVGCLIRLGSSLECFTCSSHIGITNPINDCERFNFYENHRKSVCQRGEQVCAKYVVNHDGMTWVHRSCKPYDICEQLRRRYSFFRNGRDQLLECSTCSDRNLCNSGSIVGQSFVVILVAFIVSLLYY